jgi:hypothetical protein
MAEAYQGMEQFEEAAMLIKENVELHSNNIQTLILQMKDALHDKRYSEIRKAGFKTEDLMARYAKPIEGDFIGQSFRNQIIDVTNPTYQTKNIPINIEYTDTRRRLMLDFLPPESRNIISNTATKREGVDIERTGAFYNVDKPDRPNSLNNIRRLETSINKKRMELINDPAHIKELLEIKEKADKAPKRGRPPKIQQANSQDEISDWSKTPFDPFRSLSQTPVVHINEEYYVGRQRR